MIFGQNAATCLLPFDQQGDRRKAASAGTDKLRESIAVETVGGKGHTRERSANFSSKFFVS